MGNKKSGKIHAYGSISVKNWLPFEIEFAKTGWVYGIWISDGDSLLGK